MSDVDAVLRRVVAELRPDRSTRVAGDRVAVEVDGQSFAVRAATRGRMMLRITDSTFVATGPAWPDPLALEATHSGRLHRTGMAMKVRTGNASAHAMAEHLAADPALRDAALPLDFTRFGITAEDGHLTSSITLMGASMTRMRVPPNTSWIRLHDDQRDALLATMAALDRAWATTST